MDVRELVDIAPSESIEEFQPGDTVRVNVRIREGNRERTQAFEGVVLRGSYQKGDRPAPAATFTVRRMSFGIGVERTFPYCSPAIESLKVTRRGKVRQGRIYYLRGLTGKKARIKERR